MDWSTPSIVRQQVTALVITLVVACPSLARESLKKLPLTQNQFLRDQVDRQYQKAKTQATAPMVDPLDPVNRPYALPTGAERLRKSWLSSRTRGSLVTGKPSPLSPSHFPGSSRVYDPTAAVKASPLPLAPTIGALDNFVRLQKQFFAGASVISGFYDWRTTSRWRGKAGLHFGYDVAMPYGSPFVSGWDGVVSAIVPWSDTEVGIVLQLPNGYTVTYGHVASSVRVGDPVRVGQVVGSIRLDHVDVKMRDANGNFVDFGNGSFQVPSGALAGPSTISQGREVVLSQWFLAQCQLEATQTEIQELEQQLLDRQQTYLEAKLAVVPLRQEASAIKKLREMDPALTQRHLLDEDRIRERSVRLKTLTDRATENLREASRLESELRNCRRRQLAQSTKVRSLEKEAAGLQLRWADVEKMVGLLARESKGGHKKSLASSSKLQRDRQLLVAELKNRQLELEFKIGELRMAQGSATEGYRSSDQNDSSTLVPNDEAKLYGQTLNKNLEVTKKRLRLLQNVTGDWFFEP